jgi:hypothetical protein
MRSSNGISGKPGTQADVRDKPVQAAAGTLVPLIEAVIGVFFELRDIRLMTGEPIRAKRHQCNAVAAQRLTRKAR